eukprot:570455-Hanusia_phi.AAC.2
MSIPFLLSPDPSSSARLVSLLLPLPPLRPNSCATGAPSPRLSPCCPPAPAGGFRWLCTPGHLCSSLLRLTVSDPRSASCAASSRRRAVAGELSDNERRRGKMERGSTEQSKRKEGRIEREKGKEGKERRGRRGGRAGGKSERILS